jgi:serine/threonine-protein kinase
MPPLLDHIVTRCLAKDPDERWQSAKDLHDELTWIADPRSDPAPSIRASSGRRATRLPWVLVAVAALVAAAMTGIAGWMLKPEPPRTVRRFAIVLPEGSQLPPFGNVLAVSPDATHLVYNAGATSAVGNLLYLRAMDQLAATPIQGVAAGATGMPFFSPDGQWIGFWQNGQLKKVAVTGGAPLDLCDVPALFGASWTSDGTILFGRGPDGIWQVSAGGGQPSQRITVDAKKEIAFGPQMLPGGKAVLFTLASQQVGASNQALWDNAEIVVQSLDSGKRTVVVRGGADARYVPTGHIVYVRQGTLLALPFDPARNAAIGNPVSVVDGIRQEATAAGGIGFGGTTGAAQFTVSENGLFAYVPQDTAASVARTLVWVDRHGRETALPVPDRAYVYPRISPDGTRIALDIRDQQQDIWTWDLSREILNRVTFDPAVDNNPLWTPDGRRIVFSRQGQGIFARAADGTGAEERLTESGSNPHWPNAFSRDGTRLVFSDVTAQGSDLKMLSLDDQRTVDLIARPIVGETNAEISPDGRWLAYQSNESGQLEIYVRPFPDVQGGRWQVSRAGGTRPLWARSGREVFYFAYSASGGTVMAVPVESSSGFQAGNPSKLFAGPYYAALSGRTYDVSPDGQRFLMIRAAASAVNNTPRIIVVENWFEELKRLVPTTH